MLTHLIGPPQCADKVAKDVGSVLRNTKGAARRELAAIKHYTDLEHIENSDEVCLGVCVTVWVAFAIWVGALLIARFDQMPSLLDWRWPPWAPKPPPMPGIMELRLRMHGLRPGEVFARCEEEHGLLLANLTCFVDCTKGFMDNTLSRQAFMEMDCNRDFRVEREELDRALAMTQFECPPITTTLPLPPTLLATTTTQATTTTSSQGSPTSIAPIGPTFLTTRPHDQTTAATTAAPPATTATTQTHLQCANRADELAAGSIFFVDNSVLQAVTPGLAYRSQQDLAALVETDTVAPWGSDVAGTLNGDWVKVGDLYLPTKMEGIEVMVPKVGLTAVLGNFAYSRLRQNRPLLLNASDAVREQVAKTAGVSSASGRAGARLEACSSMAWGAAWALVVRATVAPAAGVDSEGLRRRWRAYGMAPCEALLTALSAVPGVTVAASTGAPGDPHVISCEVDPSPTAQDGSDDTELGGGVTVADYKSRLGSPGEVVAVQVTAQQVPYSRLSDSQLPALRAVFVQHLATAAGVKPEAVVNLDGQAGEVSLTASQGLGNGPAAVMANCKLYLPVGKTSAQAGVALKSDGAMAALAQRIGAIPGVHQVVDGGIVDASKLLVGMAETSEDKFFQADEDFNNVVDQSEFEKAAQNLLVPPLSVDQAKAIFPVLDANDDKQLTSAEFFAQGMK